ncbi:hypothetical protein glysoja_029240 [Glycine soja]|uniref:Uncharacterized protein n=1 Tax=Glycine soja TaxID=3848 RepID=A0A0B2SUC6_GLYSO|nr:hypothetical protein glysoja_029240 [Glycine soja]
MMNSPLVFLISTSQFNKGGAASGEVVVEGGDKLGEDVEACVDELQGLDIKDVKKGGEEDDEEENKKPTLVEGYV